MVYVIIREEEVNAKSVNKINNTNAFAAVQVEEVPTLMLTMVVVLGV